MLPSETVSTNDSKRARAEKSRPIADLDMLDRIHHINLD
jgi:hypothetical protein